MEKLMKTSRIIDGFVRAFRGVCFGLAIAVAILTVLTLALPQAQLDEFFTDITTTVSFGIVELHTSQALSLQGPVRLTAALMLICSGAALGLGAWGLGLLHKVLVPMREGRPFDIGVPAALRRLGWVTLFGGLCIDVLSRIVLGLSLQLFDFSELFAPGVVTGYTVDIPMGGALIAPVVILLLSCVFQYGEQLQRQSDETL